LAYIMSLEDEIKCNITDTHTIVSGNPTMVLQLIVVTNKRDFEIFSPHYYRVIICHFDFI
jgi:hypothetical protein